MKKILSALVFAICILSVNFCSADPYENNPNYLYIGAGNGGMWYFKKSSHYSQSAVSKYIVKRYNWYTKETFHLKNGYWEKDEVNGNYMMPIQTRHFANILFYAAYGMNFYN